MVIRLGNPTPDAGALRQACSRFRKAVVWTAAGAVAVAGVSFHFAQPPAYHNFADQRTLFGIPNFTNVVSNAAFAVAGLICLIGLSRRQRATETGGLSEMGLFRIFYLASIGVGIGSALYHLAPSNLTLFWDRLPMAMCVAALASGLLAGRFGAKAGRRVFGALGTVMPSAVVYWLWSEMRGSGNVWPYLCWMYGALLVTALVLLLYEPKHTAGRHEWVALLLFAGAMLFDSLLDKWLYSIGGVMGGHALKHLLAASGMFWLWWFSLRRREVAVNQSFPPKVLPPSS